MYAGALRWSSLTSWGQRRERPRASRGLTSRSSSRCSTRSATVDELYRRAVTALDGLGRPFELVFVDDGSTDGTFAALERLHDGDPRVHAVRLKRNFGQHPAMHAGIVRARGEIVVTMDGDLQNPPEDIPRLVEAVDAGWDVASGRRAVA